MKEHKTEVLVVGAGPVGLLTAILLADAGIQVEVIDREECTAARSYACALHPKTLKLLARLGLAPALLKRGLRIPTIAFYDSSKRRAEIKLSELGGEFPFILTLPQNDLEEILEERLRQRSGLEVKWNHRCSGFESDDKGVTASVEKLGGTGTGYIVPHWETVVLKRFPFQAQFIIGADGHNSLVRRCLGIEYESVAKPESFAAIEFESDPEPMDELRIVLDDATTNVLWPLPGNRLRWTFQLLHCNELDEFPQKARSAIRVGGANVDEDLRRWTQEVSRERAPWFCRSIKDIAWCTQVTFERRLARQFGRGRCWLVGDAAHQTSPAAAQSLNVGLLEADSLATSLRLILREAAKIDLLTAYDRECRRRWHQLLGLDGGLSSCYDTDAWVRSRIARILPAVPALDGDLSNLVSQLGLNLA